MTRKIAACLVAGFFACVTNTALADKTDIVVLTNGDRITGEVKSLEAGVLSFSTDAMGTVRIEWRYVQELVSDKRQAVETSDGRRLYGPLAKPEGTDHVVIQTASGPVSVPDEQVVTVWPIEATFWDKLDLDVSAGLDYTKSTDITNVNIGVDLAYRTDERVTEASLRSDITTQSGDEDEQRHVLSAGHQYLLANRRFRAYVAQAESNDSLGIDLRVYAGVGFGKYLVKTNNKQFSTTAGLVASRETPDEGDTESNLEALLAARYSFFRFADPERSWDTQLTVFPSLTDFGRVRADFRNTFKLELVEDLYWALEIYANYDSDPLSVDADTTDYGITSSVGWSY